MAKVTVDKELCVGCGLCPTLCPEIFEMDDDDKAKIKTDSCDSCDLKDVASQCPSEAIKVE